MSKVAAHRKSVQRGSSKPAPKRLAKMATTSKSRSKSSAKLRPQARKPREKPIDPRELDHYSVYVDTWPNGQKYDDDLVLDGGPVRGHNQKQRKPVRRKFQPLDIARRFIYLELAWLPFVDKGDANETWQERRKRFHDACDAYRAPRHCLDIPPVNVGREGQRLGGSKSQRPKWYEYVNPPQAGCLCGISGP